MEAHPEKYTDEEIAEATGEEETEEEETSEEEAGVPPTMSSIAPVTIDFGRQDLNTLRDKINEVITRIG